MNVVFVPLLWLQEVLTIVNIRIDEVNLPFNDDEEFVTELSNGNAAADLYFFDGTV